MREEEEITFKTRLGRNIYKTVMQTNEIERNPVFAPGRMAYVVELNEEMAESDIPLTLLRSIGDVPIQVRPLIRSATSTDPQVLKNWLIRYFPYRRRARR